MDLFEKAMTKFSCFELVNLMLHLVLCLVHDFWSFKFYEYFELVLLFCGVVYIFERIKIPGGDTFAEDVHVFSIINAFPLLYERPPHLIKINLLNFDTKHLLQILFDNLAAS